MKYIAIRRDARFSPNSEEKDRLILQAVCDRIKTAEHLADDIPMVDEAQFSCSSDEVDVCITMARSVKTLARLEQLEQAGQVVVNSAIGVNHCQRSVLDALMRHNHIAMPPTGGSHGYWLKRGDTAAQSKDDIVFCKDKEELSLAKARFLKRGITDKDQVVSVHVVGDLVKFYGVGEQMFRYFYPTDDGISKFGDEQRNGQAHHYAFNEHLLRAEVERLARLVGVDVYGGDAIIDDRGHFYIIDFNDWPSFSRCRDEAAGAIARLVISKAHNRRETAGRKI